MKRIFQIFWGSILLVQSLGAQHSPDTLPAVWTLEHFLENVAANHPAAQNARLLDQQAQAGLKAARGAFDPKLYTDWQQKSFDGKNYYTLGSSGIKLQSAFGLSFKSEFNIARGQFLNPEDKLPGEGQAVFGMTLPLLNGLTFDPFRADLQQARLGLFAGEAQRRAQLNDLLFAAGLAFIDWSVAHWQLEIFRQATDIAEDRLEDMVESFRQGDKPAMDTLETYIQLQNRLFDLNESTLALANSRQTLETFLWVEGRPQGSFNNTPVPEALPDSGAIFPPPLDLFLAGLPERHPDLRQLQIDLQALEVDRRLAQEQLKPSLDLSYNFLAKGTDFINPITGQGNDGSLIRDLLTENYKWGLHFSFPLLFRKERGKIEQVKLKQLSTTNKLNQKQVDLEAKIRNYYNEIQTTGAQVNLYGSVTGNYRRLLEAEQIKFSMGESSVFLVNSREQKLIEAQIKLIKLQGLYRKNLLAISWAAGTLLPSVE